MLKDPELQRNWPPADCRRSPGTYRGDSGAKLPTLQIIFRSNWRMWSANFHTRTSKIF